MTDFYLASLIENEGGFPLTENGEFVIPFTLNVQSTYLL